MDVVNQGLIVALDYPGWEAAEKLVRKLPEVEYFKVGLELYLASHGQAVTRLKELGRKVFLDLKFHDIPNTVAQACRQAAGQGADMLNVHASGGRSMLLKASEAVRDYSQENGSVRPLLIAVTILTSMNEEDLQEIGLKDIQQSVAKLAILARDSGLDGVVASPQEIGLIRDHCGKEFKIICPGVRPAWAETGDQKRILTPGEAVKLGADYLVVGRPITRAADPQKAALQVIKEMKEAL